MAPVVAVPIDGVRGTDPQQKRAFVWLDLLTASGEWEPTRFRVDTGASVSTLSWNSFGPRGRNLNFDGLRGPRRIDLNLAAGVAKPVSAYSSRIRTRFPSEPRWTFSWEVLLIENLSVGAIPLLGIGGRVLSDISIAFQPWSLAFPEHFAGSVVFDILVPPTVD